MSVSKKTSLPMDLELFFTLEYMSCGGNILKLVKLHVCTHAHIVYHLYTGDSQADNGPVRISKFIYSLNSRAMFR